MLLRWYSTIAYGAAACAAAFFHERRSNRRLRHAQSSLAAVDAMLQEQPPAWQRSRQTLDDNPEPLYCCSGPVNEAAEEMPAAYRRERSENSRHSTLSRQISKISGLDR